MIDYEKEAESVFRELFCPSWMDEDDWKAFKSEAKIDIQQAGKDLKTGMDNGYSLETQKGLLRLLFKKRK